MNIISKTSKKNSDSNLLEQYMKWHPHRSLNLWNGIDVKSSNSASKDAFD